MSTTSPATEQARIERKIATAMLRGAGELRLSYRVEEVKALARYAAGAVAKYRGETSEPAVATPPPGIGDVDVLLLELMSFGSTEAVLVERSGLTLGAMRRRLSELYAALGTTGRTQAVATGYELGWLGPAARAARKAPGRPVAAPNPRRGSPSAVAEAARAFQGPSEAFAAEGQALEVLRLVGAGESNRAIAQQLGMRPNQVRYRIRAWMDRSGVRTRAALAAWAQRSGLLDAGQVAL